MKNKKMALTVLFSLLIIFISIFIYNKTRKIDYKPNVYELELIDYSKEITLKTEYGDNPNKILKWKKSMCIYAVNANTSQIKSLQKTIDALNQLTSDGFKITLTENIKKSNTVLYLCSMDSIANLNIAFYKTFSDFVDYEVDGYANIDWNNYEITKAYIYIDPTLPLYVQKSTLLEEITQCIGLPNDSEKYPKSIFYENKSRDNINIIEYSLLDKDVIQLLYHPKIIAGMDEEQVEKEILKILKNREIKLYGEPSCPKSFL